MAGGVGGGVVGGARGGVGWCTWVGGDGVGMAVRLSSPAPPVNFPVLPVLLPPPPPPLACPLKNCDYWPFCWSVRGKYFFLCNKKAQTKQLVILVSIQCEVRVFFVVHRHSGQ